jgi:hypothetical protein
LGQSRHRSPEVLFSREMARGFYDGFRSRDVVTHSPSLLHLAIDSVKHFHADVARQFFQTKERCSIRQSSER